MSYEKNAYKLSSVTLKPSQAPWKAGEEALPSEAGAGKAEDKPILSGVHHRQGERLGRTMVQNGC